MGESVNNLLYYRPVNLSVNPLNFGEFALLHAYDHDIVDSNTINIQRYVLFILKSLIFKNINFTV